MISQSLTIVLLSLLCGALFAGLLLLLFRQQREKPPGAVIALRFGFLSETAQQTTALLVIAQGLGKQIFQRGALRVTGVVGIDDRPAAGFFQVVKYAHSEGDATLRAGAQKRRGAVEAMPGAPLA